mgnify:CR=1 FL=1
MHCAMHESGNDGHGREDGQATASGSLARHVAGQEGGGCVFRVGSQIRPGSGLLNS